MKSEFKKYLTFFVALLAMSTLVINTADARGRSGSHRVGGSNSHGKGSHYYGGH